MISCKNKVTISLSSHVEQNKPQIYSDGRANRLKFEISQIMLWVQKEIRGHPHGNERYMERLLVKV